MIIYYSKEEEKVLPNIEEITKEIIKKSKKKEIKLDIGLIVRIKNKQIRDPGIIIYIDKDVLSKHKYLILKINEKNPHWYTEEEIEIIKDKEIRKKVHKWYLDNKEKIVEELKNKEVL